MDVLLLNADGTPLSLLPLSVISWKMAMKLVFLEKVKVVKFYEDWTINTPSTTIDVPSVLMTKDYIKWNKSVKYNRYNIFLRDEFSCQYCNENLSYASLTIDHVLPRSHGGKSVWENVITSCKKCNITKGNNPNIGPKNKPKRPDYYDLIAKRKKFPLVIKDDFWLTFIDWPQNLVKINQR